MLAQSRVGVSPSETNPSSLARRAVNRCHVFDALVPHNSVGSTAGNAARRHIIARSEPPCGVVRNTVGLRMPCGLGKRAYSGRRGSSLSLPTLRVQSAGGLRGGVRPCWRLAAGEEPLDAQYRAKDDAEAERPCSRNRPSRRHPSSPNHAAPGTLGQSRDELCCNLPRIALRGSRTA